MPKGDPTPRSSAGDALKQLQKAAAEIVPDVLTPELFSFATDAVNLLLARAGFPSEYRGFIDALIGASAGCVEFFDCSDLELGKRMLGSEADGKSKQAITKRVQRLRNAILEWQFKNTYHVIETMPGGRDVGGQLHKTRYKLNILHAAVVSIDTAREGGTLSDRGLREATKASLPLISNFGVSRRERFNRPRQDPEAIAAKCIKTSLTLLNKAAQLLLLNGDDPAFKFAPVLEEIERLCNSVPSGQVVDKFVYSESETPLTQGAENPQAIDAHVHSNTINIVDRNVQESLFADRVEAQPQGAAAPPRSRAALRDLDLFRSVGADLVDVTITNENKEILEFSRKVEMGLALERLPELVLRTNRANCNLIIRPRMVARRVELICLDDIPGETVAEISEFCFRVVETSPANYQGWMAVADSSYGLATRLKRGVKADVGANGATRIAGSVNAKPEHFRADGSLPVVQLVAGRPGLVIEESEIEFLAEANVIRELPPVDATLQRRPMRQPTSWPEYAPVGNRSISDYHFVHRCYEYGWHFWPDAIAVALHQVSDKARERGLSYARLIVKNALRKHWLEVEFEN